MNEKAIQEDLLKLKDGIDLAKTNLAKLDGRESEILTQLKKNHGLSSIEEANNKLKELNGKIETEEIAIEKDYKELKEAYQW